MTRHLLSNGKPIRRSPNINRAIGKLIKAPPRAGEQSHTDERRRRFD